MINLKKLVNWRQYNKKLKATEVIENDRIKIINAISKGYDIHIIWSSEDNKIDKIKKL
jgi:hypothetical protein